MYNGLTGNLLVEYYDAIYRTVDPKSGEPEWIREKILKYPVGSEYLREG